MFKHLTNFAINKKNPTFIPSNDETKENVHSHKRSILSFFEELKSKGYKGVDNSWTEIQKIVVKTLCSVQPMLKHNYSTLANDDPYN
jgi:tubulin polyglutamylase TTLL6/13